jgi:hypothetical protein
LLPLRWGINRLAQCPTFPSPERCSERWSVLSAAATRRIALDQKTGYPDPRHHFCTQRHGSVASLVQGHSIRGVEEGVTSTSFRSSGRWEPLSSRARLQLARVVPRANGCEAREPLWSILT